MTTRTRIQGDRFTERTERISKTDFIIINIEKSEIVFNVVDRTTTTIVDSNF